MAKQIVLHTDCWETLRRDGRLQFTVDGEMIEVIADSSPAPPHPPRDPQAWASSIPPLVLVPLVVPLALMASPLLMGMAFMSLTGRLGSSKLYSHPLVRQGLARLMGAGQ